MEITKAFQRKDENTKFINDYFDGKIKTVMLENLVFSNISNTKLIDYESFIWKETNGIKNINNIQMIKHFWGKKALNKKFGKRDLAIDDQAEKSLWIVKFNDSIFLVPYHNAMVFTDSLSSKDIENAINFEKSFISFCLEYAQSIRDSLNFKELSVLEMGLTILQEPYFAKNTIGKLKNTIRR